MVRGSLTHHNGRVLRHAIRADLPAIVETWVDAFSTDPYFRWIAPDDDTYEGFANDWLSLIASLCFERGHTYVTDKAAIAWVPPDVAVAGPSDFEKARSVIANHAGETRAEEALSAILTARAHAIHEPHWTLQYVGVRSADRSSGLGSAIVKIGLATADRDGLPCGLTSTNKKNLPFYARLGFTMAAEVGLPGTDHALRPMVRPAQGHR